MTSHLLVARDERSREAEEASLLDNMVYTVFCATLLLWQRVMSIIL